MRKLFNQIWHDPVWSKVISGGILALIGWVLYELNWLPEWTVRWIRAIRDYLLSPVWISVPHWLLFVLILGTGVLLLRAVVSLIRNLSKHSVGEPLHTDYNTDTIEELVWHWGYAGTTIVNLFACCPRCGIRLVPNESPWLGALNVICNGCGSNLGTHQNSTFRTLENRAGLIIEQRLRDGQWRDRVRQQQAARQA